jgi:hypothetical protein
MQLQQFDCIKQQMLPAYGALLSGGGQLWFDDISFEIVDESVKPTIPYAKEKDPHNQPTNLGFEE